MTQTNRPLNKKTLMVSPHDRYVGSVVPHSLNSNIQPDHTSSLRPHFIKQSKSYKITFAGFPLLRKETYTDKNSLDKIKNQSNQTAISLPPLYAKPPSPLCCKSDTDQNSDIFYITGSLITHGLIILIIYLLSVKFPSSPTNGNSEQGQPVDVVFMPTKTGTSGLTGAGVNGENGQTPPPPPPADLPEESQPPLPEETVPLPQPQTDPLPPDTGEIPLPIPKEPTKTTKKQPLKNHQYTYRYTPQRQQRRQQRSIPERSSNPFENMQTLDFSENPNKSKRRAATHKLPQGSRSSIDLSTGPLVKNGKINTPYAFKVNIKGVSDDYGDAINAWIRQHLYYPSDAARNGEDGSASVHVTLNRDGYVLSVTLTNSSGSDTLDAAITGMFRGARLPKIPPDLPDNFELDLTINYILIRQ